jgi:nitrate/nitrite-specific signal transduction histidine kinase
MFRYRSLTAKVIFIPLTMVVILVSYLFTDFTLMNHIKGEAIRIEMAGKLRMITVELKHSAQTMLDPDVSSEKRKTRGHVNTGLYIFFPFSLG